MPRRSNGAKAGCACERTPTRHLMSSWPRTTSNMVGRIARINLMPGSFPRVPVAVHVEHFRRNAPVLCADLVMQAFELIAVHFCDLIGHTVFRRREAVLIGA